MPGEQERRRTVEEALPALPMEGREAGEEGAAAAAAPSAAGKAKPAAAPIRRRPPPQSGLRNQFQLVFRTCSQGVSLSAPASEGVGKGAGACV